MHLHTKFDLERTGAELSGVRQEKKRGEEIDDNCGEHLRKFTGVGSLTACGSPAKEQQRPMGVTLTIFTTFYLFVVNFMFIGRIIINVKSHCN